MQVLVWNNILKQNELCKNLHPGQASKGGVWRLQRGSGVCWKTAEVWLNLSVPTIDLQLQMISSAALPEVCLCSASTHSEELNPNTRAHLVQKPTEIHHSKHFIPQYTTVAQLLLLLYVSRGKISFKLSGQKPEQNFGILMYFPVPLTINVISAGATNYGRYGNFRRWCRVTLPLH